MSGTPDGQGGELSIDVDALERSLQASIIEASLIEEKIKSGIRKQPSISMVPKHIRNGESEAYEPKILSLGPYHHSKPHLQALKQLKLLYLHRFLNRNPNSNISLRQCLMQVKERETEVRMAYTEDCNMTSNDLVQMLLLDCCFVLEIIWLWEGINTSRRYDSIYNYNPFVRTRYSFAAIAQDMLLLENQLPFFLLRHLFNSVYFSMIEMSLEKLIINFFRVIIPGIIKVPSIDSDTSGSNSGRSRTPDRAQSSRDFLHILHLIHSSMSPENIHQDDPRERTPDLTRGCCFWNHAEAGSQVEDMDYWIPCAAELRNAGIYFDVKAEKERHSETQECSFMDITFEKGRMAIPKLVVYDQTKIILRNLIAFEQCCVEAKPHVTAYAMLLDNIINTEADVELLQQSRVLVNELGDDKEVAIFFNNLCKDVIIPEGFYLEVYNDVRRHCNTECNRLRAKFNHAYFSNRWAIISLIAASLLLVLTITQAVFSVLSYIKSNNTS